MQANLIKMKFIICFGLFILIGLFLTPKTKAEVVDSSSTGFTVKSDQFAKVPPDSLFKYLVSNVGNWWNPEHTWSGNSSNLSIQPFANGCFCETLANGGSVRHMTVVYVIPGKLLRMEGGIGPLQMQAVTGSMTFEITPAPSGSKISLKYAVGGYIPGGAQKWASLVNRVLVEQVQRLVDYAETGKSH